MTHFTMNLNAAATKANADATKARLRVVDGELQVRFTARKDGAALPKGELLRALTVKTHKGAPTNNAKFTASVFSAVLVPGQVLELVPAKHGWTRLVQVQEASAVTDLPRVRVAGTRKASKKLAA